MIHVKLATLMWLTCLAHPVRSSDRDSPRNLSSCVNELTLDWRTFQTMPTRPQHFRGPQRCSTKARLFSPSKTAAIRHGEENQRLHSTAVDEVSVARCSTPISPITEESVRVYEISDTVDPGAFHSAHTRATRTV